MTMLLTFFGNENFSLSRMWILSGESDGTKIRITTEQYENYHPKE